MYIIKGDQIFNDWFGRYFASFDNPKLYGFFFNRKSLYGFFFQSKVNLGYCVSSGQIAF